MNAKFSNELVVGGCKSGKSRHALTLADGISTAKKGFIATCVPRDEEMTARVRRHQAERDNTWDTLEIPTRLPETIAEKSGHYGIMLVDCITLWLTNLMLEDLSQDDILVRVDRLADALGRSKSPIILVSNEVGAGIVPENAMARQFRDTAGLANQRLAAACDTVFWMVAGIAVKIK
ncbi:MAG: bifunctional adenosylcobinamide kinase/adenosylcobinamide-phosphate guanylyltransferase [Desulfobacteraceae bacterium]|nr:bifunctional adenosylcobinamide kinase/adenosylcobinamide-phosphate guanylyltransferase [Desulfobacteraceae bacterium]